MKRNVLLTIAALLSIVGLISYGIIWYRRRNAAAPQEPVSTGTNAGTQAPNTTQNGTGYKLPEIQTYAWWINKIGHAKFPLGMNSKGVEVLKVQETLNQLSYRRGLTAIGEDGVWGPETDARFKMLFTGFNSVTQYMFINDFDPNREILK